MSQPLLLSDPAPRRTADRPELDLDGYLAQSAERFEKHLERVCAGLGEALPPLPSVIASAVGTNGGRGSRWRPLLTLCAADLVGGGASHDDEAALDVAAAVELTHTASLVLDDMPCMDDSSLRRGRPATHKQVGSAGAILVAVGLLGRAAELLGRQPLCGGRIASDWGGMIGLAGMSGGQAIDVAVVGRRLFGAERRLHRAKSTALPAFALASGARVAGAGEQACVLLESFGRSLGWAHQLRDDAVDRAEDEQLGKQFSGPRPMVHSHRIMRLARFRMRTTSAVRREAAERLIEAAERLVTPPPIGSVRADDPASRRETEIA
ncbi:MAG: polyprenyl synthetase family protein [Myxococcota bacterium]